MRTNASSTFDILLVEDNLSDVYLTQETLRETTIPNRLFLAEDGEQALAFLRREGSNVDAPRPHLILLDLNMPNIDGRELLGIIKSDPKLRTIPVVVLTTSDAQEDVDDVYELHGNCYITKPLHLDDFSHIIRRIEEFWFKTVKLPPAEG